MRQDRTIFNGVISNENSFTELFRNFLRFQQFRHAFLRCINIPIYPETIEFTNFDTQITISTYGRPDLTLITEEIEILFEIKVWNTSLTKNQPYGYFKYLEERSGAKYKGLILIAPENYYDLKKYITSINGLTSTNQTIHTQIISWETISKIITDNELEVISPLFDEYLNFLIHWFQLNFVHFDSLNTTTMFGKEFPESLEKTMHVIDNLYEEYKKKGFNIRWTREKYLEEYGFYINLPNDESIFFGIWFDYWKETGNPICICLDSKSDKFIKAFQLGIQRTELNSAKEHDKYPTTYINKQTLMDEKCGQKISSIINEILVEMGVNNSLNAE